MAAREAIQDTIERFMTMSGYTFSAEKSKRYHTLDSFVYQYTNAGGVRDNIKIEINYSLRSHVLPLVRRPIETLDVFEPVSLLSLDSIEIFAAKTIALFTRTAARDLYDLNNLIYFGLFDETQLDTFRKCIVFYSAVGSEFTLETFDPARIDALTQREIRTRLTPMLRKKDRFDLPAAIARVKSYLSSLLCLTEKEKQFLAAFRAGEYHPEMIFDGDILARISHHPMAEWKMLGYARSHDTERSETEKASVLAQIHAAAKNRGNIQRHDGRKNLKLKPRCSTMSCLNWMRLRSPKTAARLTLKSVQS
jgi:predicted nucleotidyltransferase component of viral defense system